MERKFINQNKFWYIEVIDNAHKITFGKIGSRGTEDIKAFSSEKECLNESTKLVFEKLKKGYIEIESEEQILVKQEVYIEEKEETYF